MLFLKSERGSLSGGAFHILYDIIRNVPAVSSKVEEKGWPATSFITEFGALKEWETSGCSDVDGDRRMTQR